MRTATIQVYKFEELSQKAKDAARAEFMSWDTVGKRRRSTV